jgi:hypothetical protein
MVQQVTRRGNPQDDTVRGTRPFSNCTPGSGIVSRRNARAAPCRMDRFQPCPREAAQYCGILRVRTEYFVDGDRNRAGMGLRACWCGGGAWALSNEVSALADRGQKLGSGTSGDGIAIGVIGVGLYIAAIGTAACAARSCRGAMPSCVGVTNADRRTRRLVCRDLRVKRTMASVACCNRDQKNKCFYADSA